MMINNDKNYKMQNLNKQSSKFPFIDQEININDDNKDINPQSWTSASNSRLKLNMLADYNPVPKITTNFMENELLILQQKIAGLEK